MSQYASIPGNRIHCYAELALSSPAVTIETIASAHCQYPRRDGQAEWACIYNAMVDMPNLTSGLTQLHFVDVTNAVAAMQNQLPKHNEKTCYLLGQSIKVGDWLLPSLRHGHRKWMLVPYLLPQMALL